MTDVVVTGLGLVTPGGHGVAASWKTILAGASTAAPDPTLEGADVTYTCRVPPFDVDGELGRGAARRLDRFTHLALLAAREAIGSAGLLEDEDGTVADGIGDRAGVVLGCGIGGIASWEEDHTGFLERDRVSPLMIPKMLSNSAAGQLAIAFGLRGPNMTVNTACAAGASAIHVARDLLRSGAADVVLAGGAEAGITSHSSAAFARMGALSRREDETASRPFDVDRDGFVMGEGAGVLLLERAADAEARGRAPLAVVAGAGASADAHHITAPPEDGDGAVRAMRRALDDAGVAPGDVRHINAHGTSTPLNDAAESRAIRRVFGTDADDIAVASTKGATGHLLGAAGGVEAAFTVLALRDGVVPPTANLEDVDPEIELDVVRGAAREVPIGAAMSNSFGFGGQNASLLFTAA